MSWVWKAALSLRSDKVDLKEEFENEDEDDEDEDLAQLALENGEQEEEENAEENEGDGYFHSDFDEELSSDADINVGREDPCCICDKHERHWERIACASEGCPSTCHAKCAGQSAPMWFCQPSCALRA